ncbi:MAG: divergent polysaccharide deacetylase family protein [Alphaproteobacteria bacterium]|nr:divergent polysaccharide deacetylase family protein [Alphaproteobacteria bacterium]
MIDFLRQKIFVILIWFLTIAILASVAYVFAEIKTKPEFLNKIDYILYNKENLSPRYMIIMPDTVQSKQVSEQAQLKKQQIIKLQDEKVKITDPNDLAVEIPKIEKLVISNNLQPLDIVEITQENMSMIEQNSRKWITYSKTVDVPQKFFKVAIIIDRMGIHEKNSDKIIESVDGNVSLSFSPYARDLVEDIKSARRHGNETYLDLILPSQNFTEQDSGPLAIKLDDTPENNLKMLDEIEAQKAPIGGVVLLGQANYEDRKAIKDILSLVKDKGLLFIDATKGDLIRGVKIQNLPRTKVDIVIDDALPKEALEQTFARAEIIARERGQVVMMLAPKPVNVIELQKWTDSFSPSLSYDEIRAGKQVKKPFVLVPISTLVVE